MVSIVVFTGLTVFAAILIHRMVRADVDGRRYLQEAASERPLEIAHLGAEMQQFAAETRTLRIYLEGFLREFEAEPLRWAHNLEARLTDANRQVGEWLRMAGADMSDRQLQEMTVLPSHRAIEDAFSHGSWGERGGQTLAPAGVIARMRVVMGKLLAVERGLDAYKDPYRH